MINILRFNLKLWATIFGMVLSINTAASADLTFSNIQINEPISNNNITFDSLRQSTNHVVLILDAFSSNSFAVLNALRKKEYDGTGLIIIIASPSVQANSFIKDQKALLPNATWFHQTAQILMPALALNGTPFMFGNDAKNQTKWHYAGVPVPLEKTLPLVRDWVNKSQALGLNAPLKRLN